MIARSKNSAPPQVDSTSDIPRAKLPPLKALLAFEAASRHGSFAKGAQELGVTPSAVSHHILQLEDFLGVQLFQRNAGRAVLTVSGRAYAGEIEHAFEVIAGATSLVAPHSKTGHLVIASGPSFAAKWLQPRIADFLEANPEIRIRLSTLSDHDDLNSYPFDFAIAYGRPPTIHRQVEPFLSERLRPICSPDLAKRLSLTTPDDLSRATLIHSVNALTWNEYFRKVGCGDVAPRSELWFDRSTMGIEAAVSGLGVVLESEILASQELRDGRLIAPFEDFKYSVETVSYFLVKPTGCRNRSQVNLFERWLRSAIASDNPTAVNTLRS